MKQITLFAATCLVGAFGAASLFAADPQLLNMAMPNAQMYAGINVEQAKTSQFGQFLLAKLPVDSGFQTFIDSTGFDPRRDLTEILIATAAAPAPADPVKAPAVVGAFTSGLFMAKGTFNLPQILAAAAQDQKVTVVTYAGASLLTFQDGAQALGLIDSSTVVAGDLASVKGALDRRAGNNAIGASIMARINELSTTEDAWSVSTKSFSGFSIPTEGTGNLFGNSAVLQGIQQASGGVKFGANVQLTAQAVAQNAADAGALSDVVKLMVQMVQMHTGTNGPGQQVASLLKSLTVSTDGTTVNVSLSVPEDQLEALINLGSTHMNRNIGQI